MNIPEMTSYDAARSAFEWRLPDRFNFGRDVVDFHAEHGNGLALLWTSDDRPSRRFNYLDVSVQSSRMAHVLQRSGLRKGDRIMVQLPRIPEWHLVMTACTKLGLIPIPCIEMLTAKDVEYRASHSGAVAVISTLENVKKYAHCSAIRHRFKIGSIEDKCDDGWTDLLHESTREPSEFSCVDVDIGDPALLYYTSGSSGNPKGVTHAAKALFAWKLSAAYWQQIGHGDLNWCTADTGWAKAGTGVLFGPWGMGAAVMFHNGKFDVRRRLQLIAEHGVTVFCAAATEFRQLIQLDVSLFDLSKLRLCVSAGESVNPEVVKRWLDMTGVKLLDGYGQTETLMTILNYPSMPVKPGSMGRPIPGTDFEVLSPDGDILPENDIGQLAMRLPNPQFMLGYWNDEAKTRDAIATSGGNEYWLTGDLGYRDADGYYYYTGRSDDIISSAGYRIGPTEVENALIQHEAIVETAVIGKPDMERGEIVKAFVVLKPGYVCDEVLVRSIQDFVKAITAPYKYPREIEFVESLPKSSAGKLLRRELRSIEQTRLEGRV